MPVRVLLGRRRPEAREEYVAGDPYTGSLIVINV